VYRPWVYRRAASLAAAAATSSSSSSSSSSASSPAKTREELYNTLQVGLSKGDAHAGDKREREHESERGIDRESARARTPTQSNTVQHTATALQHTATTLDHTATCDGMRETTAAVHGGAVQEAQTVQYVAAPLQQCVAAPLQQCVAAPLQQCVAAPLQHTATHSTTASRGTTTKGQSNLSGHSVCATEEYKRKGVWTSPAFLPCCFLRSCGQVKEEVLQGGGFVVVLCEDFSLHLEVIK